MRLNGLVGIGLVLASLTGCATINPNQVSVLLNSQPAGAYLYEGSRAIGIAPQRWNYQITDSQRAAGFIKSNPIKAVWVSGAEAEIPLILQLQIGNNQAVTFSRPSNYPGLEKDLQFAMQLQQQSLTRQQIEATQSAAIANAGLQLMQAGQPRTLGNTLNCTTYQRGIYGSINCQ